MITLADIYEQMKHKRDLVLGFIFKPNCGANMQMLEPTFDNSHQ